MGAEAGAADSGQPGGQEQSSRETGAAGQPGGVQPAAAQSPGTQPGSTQPGSTQPDGTQPDGPQPAGPQPGSMPPAGPQPGSMQSAGAERPDASLAEAAAARSRPPVTGYDEVPSWPRVLSTTIVLWLQRRMPGRRSRAGGRGDSRRGAVIIAVAVICVAVAVVVVVLLTGVLKGPRIVRATPARSAAGAGASGAIAAVAATRQQAASWVAAQVSHSTVVGCDPLMCSVLRAHGFPVGDLEVFGQASHDPLGATVVVATEAVRSQFGASLDRVYAPEVLAAFGNGAARIEIRALTPGGTARYPASLRADIGTRRNLGAQLAGNANVRLSAADRRLLLAGRVDSRLIVGLVMPADERGVDIMSFSDAGPGAGPGSPLRTAVLGALGSGAQARSYLQWLAGSLRIQQPPFRPAAIRPVQVNGRPGLEVMFAAPEPFNITAP
ncbi:MAG: hypothetical protein ACLQDY_28575 [Streptosporangiaceae bacterium]